MCWGRGRCTSFLSWQCNNVIIRTDGRTVIQRESERYKLMGNIAQGDVSLTITGVQRADEGTYCCRVAISGLFNDQMKEITVGINEAMPTSLDSTTNSHQTKEKASSRSPTSTTTSHQITDAGVQNTDISHTTESTTSFSVATPQVQNGTDAVPYIIVAVVLLSLFSVAVITYRCRFQIRKLKTSFSDVSMGGSEQGNLDASRNQTVDNVYIME
ncbi:hypothetical protein FKM82_011802 [Ascaphus truei]